MKSTSDTTHAVLSVKNLSKALGASLLLSNISMDFLSGRSYAIVGESGSGKSTLLHLLAGLDRPDTGDVFWSGSPLSGLGNQRISEDRLRHIGLVFQAYYLMPHLTAIQNVELPFLLANQAVDRARCEYLLESVGMLTKAHELPRHLSGGEQQRVGIARALALRPPVILADEPTGSLDEANAERVLNVLLSACSEAQATLLMVTHSDKVARQADEQWLLSHQDLTQFNRA